MFPDTPIEPTWNPSGSDVVGAGMSKSTQCVKPPGICGTSGSCMISTNDFVPAGTSVHDSAGDGLVWPASHVNFDGILLSLVKAALVIVSAPATSRVPIMSSPSRPPWAHGDECGRAAAA